jgi:hypothetical protein
MHIFLHVLQEKEKILRLPATTEKIIDSFEIATYNEDVVLNVTFDRTEQKLVITIDLEINATQTTCYNKSYNHFQHFTISNSIVDFYSFYLLLVHYHQQQRR